MRLPFHVVKTDILEGYLRDSRMLDRAIEDLGWLPLGGAIIGSEKELGMQRNEMLRRTRLQWVQNPLIGHWVNLDTWFTFGSGLPKPTARDERVQKVVDEWWDDPDNQATMTSYAAQTKINVKRHVEGELFMALFTDFLGKTGKTRVRFIDATEIKDIITDSEDKNRTVAYRRSYTPRKYNFKSRAFEPAAEPVHQFFKDVNLANPLLAGIPSNTLEQGVVIFHPKLNCDINDLRGIPELYRGMFWASANKDANANLLSMVQSLARWVWKKTVKGGSGIGATSKAKFQTEINMSNPPPEVGSMYMSNKGFQLDPIKTPTGGTQIAETAVRRSALMVSAASGIMEHYFGDPSTGNLATSKTMELPMLKKFESSQMFWQGVYNTTISIAIDKAIEVGRLPGRPVFDRMTNRVSYETDYDRTLDFDFKSILEKETENFIKAIKIAVDARLIPRQQASQLMMMTLGVNHIEDEIKKLNDADLLVDEKEEPEVVVGPGGGTLPAKPNGNPKKKPRKGVREAISTPQHNPGRDIADKSTLLEAEMVKYRKTLGAAFTRYGDRILESVRLKPGDGKRLGEIPELEEALQAFGRDMKEAAGGAFNEAVLLGRRYVKGVNPDLEALKEAAGDSLDPDGRGAKLHNEKLEWNSEFVDKKLVPDLREDAHVVIRKSYEKQEAIVAAMTARLQAKESRVAQYAGALWSVEEAAVKEYLTGSGYLVNFVGAHDDQTCPDCSEAVSGGPYPADQAPVPGTDTICNGNCRHALQVITEVGRIA